MEAELAAMRHELAELLRLQAATEQPSKVLPPSTVPSDYGGFGEKLSAIRSLAPGGGSPAQGPYAPEPQRFGSAPAATGFFQVPQPEPEPEPELEPEPEPEPEPDSGQFGVASTATVSTPLSPTGAWPSISADASRTDSADASLFTPMRSQGSAPLSAVSAMSLTPDKQALQRAQAELSRAESSLRQVSEAAAQERSLRQRSIEEARLAQEKLAAALKDKTEAQAQLTRTSSQLESEKQRAKSAIAQAQKAEAGLRRERQRIRELQQQQHKMSPRKALSLASPSQQSMEGVQYVPCLILHPVHSSLHTLWHNNRYVWRS